MFVLRIIHQNDQQCSLFLQQRVKSTSNQEREASLFAAVTKHLFALSTSKFGEFKPMIIVLKDAEWRLLQEISSSRVV